MAQSTEDAVRTYLQALRDPSALRDDDHIAQLRRSMEETTDALQRVVLRQRLQEADTPSADRYEEDFITHAKAWADEHDVSHKAFSDEGVAPDVLRRAGFRVAGRPGRRASAGRAASGTSGTRKRVTVAEVRQAIPSGTFTVKRLQELSGASPAVVRKVVTEDEASGALANRGNDPDHRGPGRSPTLYQKV